MIWLDAHLSPRLARWIREELGHEAQPLREIGLRDADDEAIFERA
jgi:predicted nuclease of predicted toxin-antitoxin system